MREGKLQSLLSSTLDTEVDCPLAQFQLERQVRWVDTDAMETAHFSSYVRMMEEAEYAFLRSRGLSVVLHDPKGTMGFPRLSCEIKIKRPLQFGENVTVQLIFAATDGKRVAYQFKIVDADGDVAVVGRFVAALCRFPDDQNPYAILIPAEIIDALSDKPPTFSDKPPTFSD